MQIQAEGGRPALTAGQQQALDLLVPALLDRGTAALVGPAGSGKSFLLRQVLAALAAEGLTEVLAVAPTHKALAVVRSFLGDEIRNCTLASLLQLRPELDHDGLMVFRPRGGSEASRALRGQPTPELIVMDESSMVDAASCQSLQELAAGLGAGLLLVGDAAQLSPIGDGQMAELFLQAPTTAVLTEVVRNGGAVLALATAVRKASHPGLVWPTSSRSDAAGSVVLHPHQGSWQAAAARAICSPEWDRNPDSARVLCWANRSCDRLGQQLRAHRHGTAAARAGWLVGEVLLAPRGLPEEGSAMGNPRASACSEFVITEVESPTTLSELSGSYSWETPARGLPRTIEVAAEGQVQRATLKHLHTGDVVQVWLESPLALGGWDGQVRAVRNAIRQHLDGGDRKQALKQTADLGALVPLLRPASVLTLHSSQGSSFDQIWLHSDLSWCTGPEIQPLAYVGISRAQSTVHLLPMPRPADSLSATAAAPLAGLEVA